MTKLELANEKKVIERSGVYRIFWYDHDKPRPIERFCGTDDEGLLYIGRSKNLRRRISQFRNAAYGKSHESHVAGNKIFERQILKNSILLDDLRFMVKYVEEQEYKDKENKLIEDYIKKYGEVPPLNG